MKYLGTLMIGSLIILLHKSQEKRRRLDEIERLKDEIEGLRGWESEEAKCRLVANIRSLNRLGVTENDLSSCHLEQANLRDVRLRGSDMGESNLRRAVLCNADLRDSSIMNASLEKTVLRNANLRNADLFGTNLQEAELREAMLESSCLMEADLRDAKGLTIGQLLEVKTLYRAKMDENLMEQIKEKHPGLLKHPVYVEIEERGGKVISSEDLT